MTILHPICLSRPVSLNMTDQDAVGFYLSGLFDGESHFQLAITKWGSQPYPRAEFNVGMRADELPLMQFIKHFLGCGTIFNADGAKNYRRGRDDGYHRNPIVKWFVNKIEDLERIIIPFFHRYPLRAKKARDFRIWEQGVLLLRNLRATRNRDFKQFANLAAVLRAQREYKTKDLPIPEAPADLTLYDLVN